MLNNSPSQNSLPGLQKIFCCLQTGLLIPAPARCDILLPTNQVIDTCACALQHFAKDMCTKLRQIILELGLLILNKDFKLGQIFKKVQEICKLLPKKKKISYLSLFSFSFLVFLLFLSFFSLFFLFFFYFLFYSFTFRP